VLGGRLDAAEETSGAARVRPAAPARVAKQRRHMLGSQRSREEVALPIVATHGAELLHLLLGLDPLRGGVGSIKGAWEPGPTGST